MNPVVCDPTHFEELLAQAKAGNKAAFGTLMAYAGPMLRGQARRQLDQHLQAKFAESDLVQEANLRALAAIEDFHGITEKQFIAWLLVILENVAKNMRRSYSAAKRDARREVRLSKDGDELAWFPNILRREEFLAFGHLPTEGLKQELSRILQQLSEVDRKILHMVFWEGRGFFEIATRLGTSLDEVQAMYEWAVDFVRQRLKRQIP